jgi:hypothetical protein
MRLQISSQGAGGQLVPRSCLRGSLNEVAVGDERVAYAWALHLIHEAKRISLRPL